MIRAAVFAALAVTALAAPVHAAPLSAARSLLLEATGSADLRARLVGYATAHEATDRAGAGEAWNLAGWSWWRGTQPDSAILAWRRANELRGFYEDRYDLAEALLERQAPGDIDSALAQIELALGQARAESPAAAVRFRALLAWGQLLAGELVKSRALFDEVEAEITKAPLWRYRMARAALTGPDQAKAIMLLRPLAIDSRAQDGEVVKLLEAAAQRIGQRDALDRDMIERLEKRDAIEEQVVARVQGRRIKFASNDGFPLSGVLLEAKGAGRHRTAIVMVAPEDTLADFDSLAIAMRATGLHTLLLQVRGSGWSVAPECPLPTAWRGREEFMQHRVARDVRDAVRAVRVSTRNADTNSVVVVASRSLAFSGVLAAAHDARVKALVLLSPDPDPVDRGAFLATLARRPLPVFLQQTYEDFPNFPLYERAYQSTPRAASRLSDGRAPGHGAIALKFDRRITPRFVQWLGESLAPPAKKATPPAPPRKG